MTTKARRMPRGGPYRDDLAYYVEGELCGHPPGWLDDLGAKRLSLACDAHPEGFRAALAGHHPVTGEPLVQNAGSERKHPGVHLVVAPDKSVSAVLAASPPGAWRDVIDCHREAVGKAIRALAEQMTARFGPGGRYHLSAEPVVREATHLLSRAKDPHVHSHLDVLGFVYCPADGKTRALQSRQVWDGVRLFEAVYQLELGNGLMRLGYAVGQRNGAAVLRDVPRSLCRAFSSRAERIRAHAAALGLATPLGRAFAAWVTRPEKLVVDPRKLSPGWTATARKHAFSPEAIRPRAAVEGRLATPFGRHAEGVQLAVQAADDLAARRGQFTARDWAVRTTELGVGVGLPYPELRGAFDRVERKPSLYGVTLVPRKGQEPLYTTAARRPYFRRVAANLRSALTPGGGTLTRAVADAVADKARHLGAAGRAAAERVLRTPVAVAFGAAATKAAGVAREVYTEYRHPLTVVRADRPAAQAGSLDRLLADLRPTPRRRAHLEAVKAVVREPLTRFKTPHDIARALEAAYRQARRPKRTLHRRSVVVVEKAGSASPEQAAELTRRAARQKARVLWVEGADTPKAALVELAREAARARKQRQRPTQAAQQEQTR